MSLILQIDTSLENAFVCISENGIVVESVSNSVQKEHAGFIHQTIKELTESRAIQLNSLAAIAVTEGPGSYTGLRVGLASAKGFCYALNKPLITIGSLNLIARDMMNSDGMAFDKNDLFCPLIDARRMEVFTSLFDYDMNQKEIPYALILQEDQFIETLKNHRIFFGGSGAKKFENVCSHTNAFFLEANNLPSSMATLSYQKLLTGNFANLAHCEPLYVKEHQTVSNVKQ